MPVLVYSCAKGCSVVRKVNPKPVPETVGICKECQEPIGRSNQGASTVVKEKIDSGTSSRPIERLKDAAELARERAKTGPQ